MPRQRPLVSFVVAGTQKGGTSALHHMLRCHPGICLPDQKEIHFFAPRRRPEALDRFRYRNYERFFSPAPGQITGEMTPIYMYRKDCFARIAAYNPAMKIVMILRNPVERAHSQWKMAVNRGIETLSFGEAVRTEAERLRASGNPQHPDFSYCDRGRYSQQIERAMAHFPKDQIHLIRYDDYLSAREEEIGKLLAFIGADPDAAIPEKRRHGSGRGEMDPEDKAFLVEHFRGEFDALEGLTGWTLDAWRA